MAVVIVIVFVAMLHALRNRKWVVGGIGLTGIRHSRVR